MQVSTHCSTESGTEFEKAELGSNAPKIAQEELDSKKRSSELEGAGAVREMGEFELGDGMEGTRLAELR